MSHHHAGTVALALSVGNCLNIGTVDALPRCREPLIKCHLECGLQQLDKVFRYLNRLSIGRSVAELYFEQERAARD
jgi:hypothetical protein